MIISPKSVKRGDVYIDAPLAKLREPVHRAVVKHNVFCLEAA